MRKEQGVLVNARGLQTRWVAYRGILKHARARGTQLRSTNAQRARSMELHGRPRCERTMQRVHSDLTAMGLVVIRPIRRGGATPGFRDCLQLRLLETYVTPPKGAGEEESSNDDSPALPTASVQPAEPAREDPPPGGGGKGDEEDGDDEWAAQVLRTFAQPIEERRARRAQLDEERRRERLSGQP